MERMISQRRVSYTKSGTRDSKEAFRADKKSQDYDSVNSEYVAAIAAATFAIRSFEEKMTSQHQKKEKPREVEASMGNRMSEVAKTSSFKRPSRATDPYIDTTLTVPKGTTANTKVEAWERAELLKIQKRYEKNNRTIVEWENQKKTRAQRRVEEKKKELDQRRSINWQHYQNKLARIDRVAGGARSQAEKNRRKEEDKVKERAKEMRSLGIWSPKYCFLC